MLDLQALLDAGFEKSYTEDEWKTWHEKEDRRYAERAGGNGKLTKNYVLRRGDVLLTTEQNTRSSAISGIQTTVEYPEIVILQSAVREDFRTCDASDTELILLLAEEIASQGA